MKNTQVDNMTSYEVLDFKFGLITREIEKTKDGKFLIHDTSSGWLIAEVTKSQLLNLLSGKLLLSQLDWE